VTSDVHLGAVPRETEQAFLKWLEHVAANGSSLILAGDLFDFWFEYQRVILSAHFRVLSALAALADSGLPITLVGGNHDWWGGSFLRDIGLDFRPDGAVLDVAGHKALIAHGDGLGRGDLGYRALRRVLRSRITRWAFRWVHPDVGAWIADAVSDTDAQGPPRSQRQLRIAAALEQWALQHLSAHAELSLVILGHAHLPSICEAGAGRYYVNSGDWVHHRSYVILEEKCAPRLERWGSTAA
jgi:UDP-2,3-diacylglucosamine hydrolase